MEKILIPPKYWFFWIVFFNLGWIEKNQYDIEKKIILIFWIDFFQYGLCQLGKIICINYVYMEKHMEKHLEHHSAAVLFRKV